MRRPQGLGAVPQGPLLRLVLVPSRKASLVLGLALTLERHCSGLRQGRAASDSILHVAPLGVSGTPGTPAVPSDSTQPSAGPG